MFFIQGSYNVHYKCTDGYSDVTANRNIIVDYLQTIEMFGEPELEMQMGESYSDRGNSLYTRQSELFQWYLQLS